MPAEEAGAKAAKAEAVDWEGGEAGWGAKAVTAGWVAVKGDWGSEAVDWVAALGVVGSEEAQEAKDSEAWEAAESCAVLHRTGTRCRSRNQPCGCIEHQIQKNCIVCQSVHPASAI